MAVIGQRSSRSGVPALPQLWLASRHSFLVVETALHQCLCGSVHGLTRSGCVRRASYYCVALFPFHSLTARYSISRLLPCYSIRGAISHVEHARDRCSTGGWVAGRVISRPGVVVCVAGRPALSPYSAAFRSSSARRPFDSLFSYQISTGRCSISRRR